MKLRDLLLIGIALATAPLASFAQAYPNRPVRIIVPYSAGGEGDVLARGVAQRLSEKWKQPVIVDNRTGGGTVIGTDAAAKAEPDGYTLLFTSFGFVTTQLTGRKLPYSPADLTPLMLVATAPLILYVNPQVPAKTFQELVAYAKAHPKSLSFGSSGNGSSPHLAAELFAQVTRTEITHIPYKGIAPALMDLNAGHINALWGAPNVLADVRAGKLRAIAAAKATRVLAAPDLPTTTEAGYGGLMVSSWYGLLIHSKVPADLRRQILSDVRSVVQSNATRAQVQQMNFEPLAMEPDQFASFLSNEVDRWGRTIRERKLSID